MVFNKNIKYGNANYKHTALEFYKVNILAKKELASIPPDITVNVPEKGRKGRINKTNLTTTATNKL